MQVELIWSLVLIFGVTCVALLVDDFREKRRPPRQAIDRIQVPALARHDAIEPDPAVRHNRGFQLIQPRTAAVQLLSVPARFQDARALEKLKASKRPFSGLVVSVGITPGGTQAIEELAQNVGACLRTLLRDADFACRNAEDEYVLLCPNLNGEAAQRQLNALFEHLWDFQLRSLGSFPMQFSLGGVDVEREPLALAIASATERMSQAKRRRKAV